MLVARLYIVNGTSWAYSNKWICLNNQDGAADEDDDDDEDLLSNLDETDLESYSTPLDRDDSDVDEYWVFKSLMQRLEGSQWGALLTGPLSQEQRAEMREVATLADQRRAAQESRRIQQSGGQCVCHIALLHSSWSCCLFTYVFKMRVY